MFCIVTVKLPRNPNHNPRNKQRGICPLFKDKGTFGAYCTDTTGEHHSVLIQGDYISKIREEAEKKYGHITRIEEVTVL